MERIDYFKVFAFLAFAGSAFLSTVFHYPVFTIVWFIVMMLFMVNLASTRKSSELTILAIIALSYIPLGLISVFSNYVSRTAFNDNNISPFAWLLSIFATIELIIAIIWIKIEDNRK